MECAKAVCLHQHAIQTNIRLNLRTVLDTGEAP
jgi:hypothetical protein